MKKAVFGLLVFVSFFGGGVVFAEGKIADPASTENWCGKRNKLPPIFNGGMLPGPAQDGDGLTEDGICYVSEKLVPSISNKILVFLFSLGVIILIIAGLLYIVSSGDTELTGQAKDTLLWACIGIGLAVISYAIVKLVINIDFFEDRDRGGVQEEETADAPEEIIIPAEEIELDSKFDEQFTLTILYDDESTSFKVRYLDDTTTADVRVEVKDDLENKIKNAVKNGTKRFPANDYDVLYSLLSNGFEWKVVKK